MSWDRRRAIVEAGVLVSFFGVAVRIFSFDRVRRWAERPASKGTAASSYAIHVFPSAAAAVGRRLFPSHPCLPEALAVSWRSRRAGLHTTLRIGVAKGEAAGIKAHAWVEYDGEVLIGGSDAPDQYTPFRPLEGSG